MASPVYTPTASQWASAIVHLENRDDWRYLRIDGTRYVSLVSGRSNRVYLARATADGCSCPWYQQTGRQCSHCLAIYLDATMDDLREGAEEAAAVHEAEVELAFAALATAKRGNGAGVAILKRYEDIFGAED